MFLYLERTWSTVPSGRMAALLGGFSSNWAVIYTYTLVHHFVLAKRFSYDLHAFSTITFILLPLTSAAIVTRNAVRQISFPWHCCSWYHSPTWMVFKCVTQSYYWWWWGRLSPDLTSWTCLWRIFAVLIDGKFQNIGVYLDPHWDSFWEDGLLICSAKQTKTFAFMGNSMHKTQSIGRGMSMMMTN